MHTIALLFVLYIFHADGSITTVDNIQGYQACAAHAAVVVGTTEVVIPVKSPKTVLAARCVAKSGSGTQTE